MKRHGVRASRVLAGARGVLVAAGATLASACGGETLVSAPVPVQCYEGAGLVGRALDLVGFRFPLDASFVGSFDPQGPVRLITFESLTLRTVDASEATLSGEALTRALLARPEAFERCEPGRGALAFIESMDLTLQRVGGADPAPLASYRRAAGTPAGEPCGFAFDVDSSVRLDEYLPRYELRVTANAKAPSDDVCISGLARLRYETGF